MKNARLIILMFLISVLCSSCQPISNNISSGSDSNITVIASKDFGSKQLGLKKIPFEKDSSVMDITEDSFDVETAYGGSFINSIGGLKSGYTNAASKQKLDWFYYVNGVLSQVGAADYITKAGDLIIWDYHSWDGDTYISSIIGAYPKTFINGYGEDKSRIEILYSDEYKGAADSILDYLKKNGASDITVSNINEKSAPDKSCHTILIGKWDEIMKTGYSDIVKNESGGIGKYFSIGKNINLLNYKGENPKKYEKGAIITSYIKDYSSMNTLWLLTGNDKESIEKASELLYKYPDKLIGKFGLLISGSDMISFPAVD